MASKKTLTTKDDVAQEIKEWIENVEIGQDGHDKSYFQALRYIELLYRRPLSYLELTWFQRQYVKTLLQLWLKKSLEKAFEYLNDEKNDVSQLSTVLTQLNSINSFEDIRSKLKDAESPLFNWCDGDCRFLKLILEQKDLFKKTPRFPVFVNCYLKQFKTSCIEKVFSQCLGEIVDDPYKTFIANLNVFLSSVNEEKNLMDILEKEKCLVHYVKSENKTGQDIIKQLVSILSNSTETEHEGTSGEGLDYWLQTFLTIAKSISEEKCWTPKLQLLTKETCKRFLLPETEIESKVEDGKEIIFITGVAIYVSKMMTKMVEFKVRHTDNKNENTKVQQVKIVALQSVHIDCGLNNDTWHGINIDIVTDKLIVDGEVCWDVSGKTVTINPSRDNVGKFCQPGESGGNVHVVCNQIINGQKWTIVSDGGNGSDCYKWTKEEFEKSFPSMSTDDREENTKTVLTTLAKILPRENRTRGENIMPGHKGNFFIDGTADDGSEITATFYEENNIKGSLILVKRGHIGQGGYGGDITVECLSPKGSSSRKEIPFAGTDTSRKPLTNIRMGVYEASGSNGKTGKMTGDVAFIHKVGQINENFYGFEEDKKILIKLDEQKPSKPDIILYVQYESKKYAKLTLSPNYSTKHLESVVIRVDAVKKNAAIRQNLLQHFDQINERKQMSKLIQKMLLNPTEDHSSSIDEIINEMDNKVHQFHQLTTQCQQNQLEQIQQEQYVRSAIESFPPSFRKPKIIGRRPVLIEKSKEEKYKTNVSVYCFDELQTENGIDSTLHCLFGQVNSEGKYVCKDTNHFRKRIAKHIREEHDIEKTYNVVGMFVLRVKDDKRFPAAAETRDKHIESITTKYQQLKGMETQVLRWLNHNDDYDNEEFLDPEEVDEWEKAWEAIGNPKTIKAELLKEQEDWRIDEDLKQECAKYIESSTGALGLAELELLTIILPIKINIYVNHDSSCFEYKGTLSSRETQITWKISNNTKPSRKYCILYEGNGRWKRLATNYNLNLFCKVNATINRIGEIETLIKKLKNETPLTLFEFLVIKKNHITNDSQINQLIGAICSLKKWIDYYNSRNVSPFFYVHIVETYDPHQWECEFLLLEMEEGTEKQWENEEDRNNWRRVLQKYFKENDRALSRFVKIAIQQIKENDILFSLDLSKLFRILTVLEKGYGEDLILNEDDIGQKCAMNLFYGDRGAFWEKIVDDWSKTEKMTDEKKKEYVNLLLEMEYKNEIDLAQNLTHDTVREIEGKLDILFQGRNSTSIESSRTVDEVLDEMRRKMPETELTEMIEKTIQIVKDSKLKHLVSEKDVKSIVKKLNSDGVDLNDNPSVAKFLSLFDCAVKEKMKFSLRDTQRVAITILLVNGLIGNTFNTLAQVSTGEGKSIIVAGVAIGFALSLKKEKREKNRHWKLNKVSMIKKEKINNKVDVITSNDVLALRDSSLPVAEGGLKELYEFFDVTVANNCSQSVEERKKAYNTDVVYGQLANFQRDYLLDTFYDRKIRGDRPMEFVIIDEADCMLLDRGSNVLYLSHDIPGMEMLESLYVFIWEQIRDDTSPDIIKSAVLFDLYGQITEKDLNSIHLPLGQIELESERSEMWEHLIDKKVINQQGRLLIKDVNEITEEIINYESTNETLKEKQIKSKIVFYLRTIIKRERRIRIPHHLLDFVDRHLDTWLDNARRALDLKQDEDYVIDCDRSDPSPDLNPQVIIIDPETGTDQFNSQWDGALHQFLQLKEGCKLTLQSLKAVFISNAKYMKQYNNIAGVSGTLGSKQEQEFLKRKYDCEFFTIPTAFLNSFNLKPPKLLKTKDNWLKAIAEETRKTITNRSIVIFCRSIEDVNQVYQYLRSVIQVLSDDKRIHRYARDYEKFRFEKEPGLDVGNVIVATNLAGRGTDIKLSPTLKANGGLHICLTCFPENERVEEQAMGRAARKGELGSGILILCEPQMGHQVEESGTSEEWGIEKIFVMKEERAWKERQRISRMKKDFNNMEMLDELIQHFTDKLSVFKINEILGKDKFQKVKDSSENRIVQLLDEDVLLNLIHNNTLDRWALWLDERDYNFKCFDLRHKERKLKMTLHSFAGNESNDILKWMTPARRITITKHHAMAKTKHIIPTDTLFEFIHSPDHFFYPSAFYYHAFILLTKSELGKNEFKKEKKEFIRTLRSAETILNEHIDMQISFIQIHESERKTDRSFYDVDGYREQKTNNIKILQCFISSIQSLLGTHYLTASDIEEQQPQLKRKRANGLFKWLIESKYIECAVNKTDTVPNYNDVIRKIANKYDVKLRSLENKLSAILEKVQRSAIDIEKELENEDLILCSKETFWSTLVKVGALIDDQDIIVMDDSECDVGTKLDRNEKVTHNFTIDGYVQYEPKYFSQTDLENKKKIMFPKNYVTDTVLREEYRQRKPKFESNKIAKINFEKLEAVDLNALGQLTKDHLRHSDFNPTERQVIWNELKEQGIIDDQGYYNPLAPDFKYSDCLIYEVTVNCLIEKTFPAEFVRRKWLEMKSKDKVSGEYLDCIKSINLLPEKPYCEMFGELMASHVISGARVTDDIKLEAMEQKLKEITDDKEELNCILEILKQRQADYVATKTNNVTLESLEGEIKAGKYMRNIWSEFHVFRLIGFDCIISIEDRKKSWKTNTKAIAIFLLGVAEYTAGVAMNLIPLGIATSLIGDFTKTGLDDIYYGIKAFNSPNDLMFYYRNQKIKSLKESEGLLLRGGASLAQQINKKIKEKRSQS
uniref:Helicase c-terminal domain containing protein n=1 Tax=Daphnia galeata TaxID=27404 RepID=A0A8J2RH19_9CRUS|nr:unnamed protein product [Daphnia galeata]